MIDNGLRDTVSALQQNFVKGVTYFSTSSLARQLQSASHVSASAIEKSFCWLEENGYITPEDCGLCSENDGPLVLINDRRKINVSILSISTSRHTSDISIRRF